MMPPGDTPQIECSGSPALALKVRHIASQTVLRCAPSTPVAEAAAAMRRAMCGSILIMDAGRLVGIWTERDTLRLDLSDPATLEQPIAAVMSTPVKRIHADAPVSEAGLRFKQETIRHLVVVDDNDIVIGGLSQTDVVLNHGVEHYLTFRDVRSVMGAPPPRLPHDAPLSDAIRCLAETNSEVVVVLDDGEHGLGVLTERDLVRLVAERRTDGTVGDQASRSLITISPNATLLSARDVFAVHGVRHLVVAEADEILGLLSFTDILTTLHYEYASQLNAALHERDEALMRSRYDLLLARRVIEASLEGVMIVDEAGLIEYVNPAFTRITGYSASEAIGLSPSILKSGRQDAAFYDDLWRALREQNCWQGEIWNRRKDGTLYAEWLSINVMHEGDHAVRYAAIFSDITARKEREERIQALAFFDELTGLPNRRLLLDRLGVAIASAHRHVSGLAVMFLDLDLFKGINDTLGHAVGDQVLVATARRLQQCVREGDTVARIGGDEFVILLPEIDDPASASEFAERVIAVVGEPLPLADKVLAVTASLGFALYPDDGRDPEALLKRADEAMYQAKQLGRNRQRSHRAA